MKKQRIVSEHVGELMVVYIPQARYFAKDQWEECEHEMVVSLTKNLEIELVDLVPIINNLDDPRSMFASNIDRPGAGGHPNREGYRLIADQIIERLRTNNGVP